MLRRFVRERAAGCNGSTPTAPTPPAPPVVSPLPPVSAVLSISLVGDMWIPTNVAAPVQMTARLITSTMPFEYTSAIAGVTWSIEPAGVALIDQHGRVSPVSIGTATVTARYGDKTGINPIRVLPDYSGNWSGQFRITGCTGGFDFRECGRMMAGAGAGTGTGAADTPFYPFTITLSQVRDQVTGTVRESRVSGELVYPVSGIVRVSGHLVLEATAIKPGGELRVFNWSSTTNAGVTARSGAFTKIEPYRNVFNDPYTIKTEHEFSGAAHVP
jgi:hypothetical protein